MFDPRDVDRVAVLAGKAEHGRIAAAEKGEMRRILTAYSPRVQDLSWNDVLHCASVFLGISELAGRRAADAS